MSKNKYSKKTTKDKIVYHILIFAAIAVCGLMAARYIYSIPLNYPPIRSDGEGYYMYLPAFLIEHDPGMNFVVDNPNVKVVDGVYVPCESGARIDKYSMGTALMEMPFFLIAHALTLILKPSEANGFTTFYQWSVIIASCVWYFIGAFFSYLTARKFASPRTACAAVVLCTFCSNLFHYFAYDSSFSHIYSFAMIAIFVYSVVTLESRKEDPSFIQLFLMGLFYGLIVLIRTTDAPLIIIYGLYGVYSFKSFTERIKKIFAPRRLFPPLLGAIAGVLPQVIYWLIAAGSVFVNSYGGNGEGFPYWYCPKIFNTLFLLNKGIFLWCPALLIFTIIAIIQRKKTKELFLPIAICFFVLVYIFSSWWCYDFAGSFAHRMFVNIMSFFIICASVSLDKLKESKPVIRYSVYALIAISIVWTMVLMFSYWYYVIPFSNYTLQDIGNAFKWFLG